MPSNAPARRGLECFWLSLKLGLTSFGGPIAHLGYFERAYVRDRQWLSADDYASLVALCQVLPGPASSQVNFLVNLQRGGFTAAILAFIGFTLPSVLLMFACALYLPQLGAGHALLHGLKLTAVVIVAQALWSMIPKLCPDVRRTVLAVLVMCICLLFGGTIVQVGVLVLGAVYGVVLCRPAVPPLLSSAFVPTQGQALRALLIFVLLLVGLPLLAYVQGEDIMILADIFYRAGALVFGGGHVVLPLLTDGLGHVQGVDVMALYGAAQAVPGPMFSVAAGLGASALSVAPVLGAGLATLMIFLPGLLLAVAGLRYWAGFTALPSGRAALAGMNAAVIGLLTAAFINPVAAGAVSSWFDAAFVLILFTGAQRWRLSPLWVIAACIAYAFAVGAWHAP